jgi:hypothetical protein
MYGKVVVEGNERGYAEENCFFHLRGKETLSRPVKEAEIPGPGPIHTNLDSVHIARQVITSATT